MELAIPIHHPVLQFTVLAAMALLVKLTVERIKLPGLVGLLLIGVVLGPDALGVMSREPVAELMGEIGLVYIMFLAGVEINLDVLKQHRREVAVFGLLSFGVCFVLTLAVAVLLLSFSWPGALMLATALSSHTLVAYPIVKRLGLLQRQPAVTAVGGTLLTDTLALVALAVLVEVTAQQGQGGAWGWLAPLAMLAALVVVAGFTLPRLGRRLFASNVSRAEKALFVLVALLVLASVARIIGTESILGAFLAGLCLNRSIRGREELHEHLGFVGRMVFIPFFYVDTGMRIDPAILGQAQVWLMAAGMLVAVLAGKAIAAWLTGRMHGYSGTDRALMIGLTVPQAAATLAVTVTASAAGVLDEIVVDAVVLVILVTCLIGPLLTRYAGHRLLQRNEPARQSPVESPREDLS